MKITLASGLFLVLSCPPLIGQEETKYDTSKPAEKLVFEYRLGTIYDQKMDMKQSMKMNIGGQAMDQEMTMTQEMEINVTGSEAAKKLEFKYGRVSMEMDMMGQKMAFDSEKPEPDSPFAGAFEGMVGSTFSATLDENNNITLIEGLDEAIEKSAGNPIAAQVTKQMLNEDNFKNMLNNWYAESFPDNAVKAGDSWPMDMEIGLPGVGKMNYTGTYKHLGHTSFNGHDCVVIQVDGKMEIESGGDGDTAKLGMELNDAGQTGVMYWDNKLGYFRGMDLEQKMTMSMPNPAGDGPKMKMPIIQNIKTAIETR